MNLSGKKITSVKVRLLSNGTEYPGTIESLSDGIMYVTATSGKPSDAFNPGALLDLNFHSPAGDISLVHCRVKWSYRTPPHGITNSIGMEVLNDDLHYEALLKVIN